MQAVNATPSPDRWENLFNHDQCTIKQIQKRLACNLSDAADTLLACCKFRRLNVDWPQCHNVMHQGWTAGNILHSLQAKTCTLDARTDGFDLPEASRFS